MAEAFDQLSAALADRYRIERELGAGGMATVYLAHDVKHDRKVALKVLRPELAHAIGPERFLREITTTANLRHPHILPLYDSGRTGTDEGGRGRTELLYYVMPFVEGESLRDRLDREMQLPVDEALRIAREVADALSYAHSRGVIHRDIKPENILLESGHAVVADFGIARAVDAAGGAQLTETGLAIGTPSYMSPEQAAGERELDGRSDLYALGCVLYEMLGGEPPFTGPTVESVIHQHLTAEPKPITQLRPAVPAEIAGVLQRALAKTPADRFNPVAQFGEALRAPDWTPVPTPVSWRRRIRIVTLPLLVIGAVGAVMMMRIRAGTEPLPELGSTVQVTREPGLEVDPAISPDGQLVAYAAGPVTSMQIYVRQVTGGRTVQLTSDSTRNHRWPRWSPDGARIAYQTRDGVHVIPALGGAPRLIVRTPTPAAEISIGSFTTLAGLAWSPDGRRIAFVAGYGPGGLYVVDVAGGEATTLDAPREPFAPAWSPDGTRIAVASGNLVFVFGMVYFANAGTSSVWVVPVDGGPPRQLTDGASMDLSPQWAPSGRSLYFVSDRGGSRDVYRLPADGRGEPVRLTTGLDAQTITLSPDGTQLVYNRLQSTTNIWSMPVPAAGPGTAEAPTPITTGNQMIEDVDVSRDGRWLVFDSDRGGNADLYTLPVGGGEPVQLTTDPAGDYSPVWSPDGTRIAFHSLRTGNRDLFTINADGTGLTQHTADQRHELDPTWAPDGRAVAVETIDSTWTAGNFVIVPMDRSGAEARMLVGIGDFPMWSPAGDVIAYHTADGIGLLDPAGGPPRPLVSNAADGSEAFYAAWSPDGRTLYYLARGDRGWVIRAIPRTGGPSRVLVRFDDPDRQPAKYGFATDGRRFYFTMGSHEADVWALDLNAP